MSKEYNLRFKDLFSKENSEDKDAKTSLEKVNKRVIRGILGQNLCKEIGLGHVNNHLSDPIYRVDGKDNQRIVLGKSLDFNFIVNRNNFENSHGVFKIISLYKKPDSYSFALFSEDKLISEMSDIPQTMVELTNLSELKRNIQKVICPFVIGK
jgi:hypothetical protein